MSRSFFYFFLTKIRWQNFSASQKNLPNGRFSNLPPRNMFVFAPSAGRICPLAQKVIPAGKLRNIRHQNIPRRPKLLGTYHRAPALLVITQNFRACQRMNEQHPLSNSCFGKIVIISRHRLYAGLRRQQRLPRTTPVLRAILNSPARNWLRNPDFFLFRAFLTFHPFGRHGIYLFAHTRSQQQHSPNPPDFS